MDGVQVEKLAMAPAGQPVGNFADKQNGATSGGSFGDMLLAALNNVNDLQNVATQKNIDLVSGNVEDISEVMIAGEKAGVAMQMTVAVSNKILDAYREVMRMQL
ncbi:MAG: flagellar hook-basal body complex protein FliE [Negativicutes bacterium]|nr:flagellar hook-basal body complex protein FliE [Negativicutes bacterium]